MATPPSPTALAPEVFDFSLAPPEFRRRAEAIIADANADLESLIAHAGAPTVDGFLRPLDEVLHRVQNAGLLGYLMFNVHPAAESRAAGRELGEAGDRFFNGFRASADAYRRLRALELTRTDESTRFAVKKLLRDMRRAGAEQDAATRARIIELSNEVDATGNAYAANLAQGERHIDVSGPEELAGLPADYIAAHAPSASGTIRITTTYPDFLPVMAYGDREDVRRRLLHEYMNRASRSNAPVLAQLLERRHQFARLVGYPNYAVFALEDKMVESSPHARSFLDQVADTVRAASGVEVARTLARKRVEQPGAERLEAWDASLFATGYYDTKLKTELFGVDAKVLRSYLPYGAVRRGLFSLCEELFGLTFAPAPISGLWHDSVEAFDASFDGRPLGRFFLDMVPRDGKFGHAACFTLRVGQGGRELPQAVLVCNFIDPKDAKETARMDYNQVVTFFHEFGHLLHALFAGHGDWLYNGMSYIEWDFIEAPSQLFEEWARDPATLGRFAVDPDSGRRIPEEILAQLNAADGMGRASRWLRQVALSSISLELYDRDPTGIDPAKEVRTVWDRIYPLPMSPDYHLETSFGHLTGYSAFYYTYVWSLVIARDLLSPFRAKGNLADPELAQRYAREILMPGSTRPAAEMVERFLGRPFDFRAFQQWIADGVRASGAGAAPA